VGETRTSEETLPVSPHQLDGPTIERMLRPNGVLGLDPATFQQRRYLAVAISPERLADMTDDDRMELKDDILRAMDDRLMEAMGL
jgi:hypothetical protein